METLSLSQFLKLTIDTMIAVESVYPEGGKGKDKFDAVMAQVMVFAPLANVAAGLIDAILPSFIARAVAVFNTIGKFKKTAPTPVAV
jgi:hypothetical protein